MLIYNQGFLSVSVQLLSASLCSYQAVYLPFQWLSPVSHIPQSLCRLLLCPALLLYLLHHLPCPRYP